MLPALNFFAPYESLAPGHENQLTRALLVVLRYSPLAHAAWLRFVAPELRIEELPPARFRTQRAQLLHAKPASTSDEGVIRGISVWLAPDPRQHHAPVGKTDRRQILDGVVEYGDALVVAIENKVHAGEPTVQPTSINADGAAVEFDPHVRSVAWQALLESLADLSLRGLVAGAEQKVIDDFLAFAEHHFPQVGPYSTLRRAAGSLRRVERRLDAVLAAATGVQERARQDAVSRLLPEREDEAQRCVDLVFLDLHPDGSRVCLRMYPGDTLSQAKVLYKRAAAARGLLDMPGWKVRTNYHWGFITTGYCWAHGTITAHDYIEHWIGAIRETSAVPRERWDSEWARLEALGIVAARDHADFQRHFIDTRISKATPRPGLCCEFSWPIEDATVLDDRGGFVDAVRAEIAALLRQLDEPCALPAAGR